MGIVRNAVMVPPLGSIALNDASVLRDIIKSE